MVSLKYFCVGRCIIVMLKKHLYAVISIQKFKYNILALDDRLRIMNSTQTYCFTME